jgi:hypothetical protein
LVNFNEKQGKSAEKQPASGETAARAFSPEAFR